MIKFKIKDKTYEIPTKWEEITIDQFIGIDAWDKKDIVRLISVLTDAPYDIVYNADALYIEENVLPSIEFLKETPDFNAMPKTITLKGKEYPTPKDEGFFTFGQKILLQNKISETVKENRAMSDCISFAIANYYQPIISGKKHDDDLVELLESEIGKTKMFEAYPVGAFFLRKSIGSSKEIQLNLMISRIPFKSVQGLARWIFSRSLKRLTV